jgi:uncharacterized protein YcgI (DUF1989 family)
MRARGVALDYLAALRRPQTRGLRLLQVSERLQNEEIPPGGAFCQRFAITSRIYSAAGVRKCAVQQIIEVSGQQCRKVYLFDQPVRHGQFRCNAKALAEIVMQSVLLPHESFR